MNKHSSSTEFALETLKNYPPSHPNVLALMLLGTITFLVSLIVIPSSLYTAVYLEEQTVHLSESYMIEIMKYASFKMLVTLFTLSFS